MESPLLPKEWTLSFSEEEGCLDPSAGRMHVDPRSIAAQVVFSDSIVGTKLIRAEPRGKKATRPSAA